MKDSQRIYDELWNSAVPLLESGKYETDPSIIDSHDMRRGLTIRAKLSPSVIEEVRKFTDSIGACIPGQYITPDTDLHLTVLTVVHCSNEYRHDPNLEEEYCRIIENCIEDIRSFSISFNGITASSSCLLLCGFPVDGSLRNLRNNLRKQLSESGLPNSFDFRYPLKTAHSTIMRFTAHQEDISEFTRYIKANRNRMFGTQVVNQIEFVINDWCHKKDNTKVISAFELNEYP